MSKMLEGMEKFVRMRGMRGRRKGDIPYLSISKSGWATIRDALVEELNCDIYSSVDFFIKPNDKERHIAFVLYKGDKGELGLRLRRKMPNPVGCGFCVMRLVRHRPEYIGLYEIENTEVAKDRITVLMKPVKHYV